MWIPNPFLVRPFSLMSVGTVVGFTMKFIRVVSPIRAMSDYEEDPANYTRLMPCPSCGIMCSLNIIEGHVEPCPPCLYGTHD
jgi:hypothetical protein